MKMGASFRTESSFWGYQRALADQWGESESTTNSGTSSHEEIWLSWFCNPGLTLKSITMIVYLASMFDIYTVYTWWNWTYGYNMPPFGTNTYGSASLRADQPRKGQLEGHWNKHHQQHHNTTVQKTTRFSAYVIQPGLLKIHNSKILFFFWKVISSTFFNRFHESTLFHVIFPFLTAATVLMGSWPPEIPRQLGHGPHRFRPSDPAPGPGEVEGSPMVFPHSWPWPSIIPDLWAIHIII